MKEIDRVWLAAIIDGEGCLSISHFLKTQQSGYLDKDNTCTFDAFITSVSISNNCKELIDKAAEITDTNTKITEVKRKGRGTNYRWKVSSNKDILQIIEYIEPYVIAKAEQVQVMKEFIKIRMQGRGRKTDEQKKLMIELADELSSLNHFVVN